MDIYEAQGFRVDAALIRRRDRDWAEAEAWKRAAAVTIKDDQDAAAADALVMGVLPRKASR